MMQRPDLILVLVGPDMSECVWWIEPSLLLQLTKTIHQIQISCVVQIRICPVPSTWIFGLQTLRILRLSGGIHRSNIFQVEENI